MCNFDFESIHNLAQRQEIKKSGSRSTSWKVNSNLHYATSSKSLPPIIADARDPAERERQSQVGRENQAEQRPLLPDEE